MKEKATERWSGVLVVIAVLMLFLSMAPGALVRSPITGLTGELLFLGIPSALMLGAVVFVWPRRDPAHLDQGYEVFHQLKRARVFLTFAIGCGGLVILGIMAFAVAKHFGLWATLPKSLAAATALVFAPVMACLVCLMIRGHAKDGAEKAKAVATIPFCDDCGYPFTGLDLPVEECPECGTHPVAPTEAEKV